MVTIPPDMCADEETGCWVTISEHFDLVGREHKINSSVLYSYRDQCVRSFFEALALGAWETAQLAEKSRAVIDSELRERSMLRGIASSDSHPEDDPWILT